MPIGAVVVGQPEVYFLFKPGAIDEQGGIADEGSRAFLKGCLDRLSRWIAVTRQLQQGEALVMPAGGSPALLPPRRASRDSGA